ncbi:Ubiquitin domain [Carpediemonas membranifera]|uniref:Ubiquitin domain n=1 Tax=Carpediemonas membranifera TaxID=201153 RepID=A0A8J6B4R1_9EUKA|nr:Ubiquitin domain [Carpediemonas membranifera]|eukprot:KAG9395658.1 Ubiquitin domain [Carpediemonas membranifera]
MSDFEVKQTELTTRRVIVYTANKREFELSIYILDTVLSLKQSLLAKISEISPREGEQLPSAIENVILVHNGEILEEGALLSSFYFGDGDEVFMAPLDSAGKPDLSKILLIPGLPPSEQPSADAEAVPVLVSVMGDLLDHTIKPSCTTATFKASLAKQLNVRLDDKRVLWGGVFREDEQTFAGVAGNDLISLI